jgi:hypothetical protein
LVASTPLPRLSIGLAKQIYIKDVPTKEMAQRIFDAWISNKIYAIDWEIIEQENGKFTIGAVFSERLGGEMAAQAAKQIASEILGRRIL